MRYENQKNKIRTIFNKTKELETEIIKLENNRYESTNKINQSILYNSKKNYVIYTDWLSLIQSIEYFNLFSREFVVSFSEFPMNRLNCINSIIETNYPANSLFIGAKRGTAIQLYGYEEGIERITIKIRGYFMGYFTPGTLQEDYFGIKARMIVSIRNPNYFK